SVPFFTRKPLLETVKGFFRLGAPQGPLFILRSISSLCRYYAPAPCSLSRSGGPSKLRETARSS
ncbi:hypothetical protein, partial [Sphingobacterium puteale]|uniref:hypothetical protein n=1 Tax=Sphingobacterium puteale TaxID=2420510 RepID=UPI001C7DD0CE